MNISATIERLRQVPPDQLLQRASRTLPPWIALVLTVAVAWQLGRIVWMLVPAPYSAVVAPPPVSAATSIQQDAGDTEGAVQGIVAAHLFGEFNPAAQSAPQVVVEAPDPSELPEERTLKLLGVIATEQGDGQAIIVNNRGEAAVYLVGQPVKGEQVRVDAVYPTWVRLNKNGRFTRLSLPEVEGLKPATPTRRLTSAVRRPARNPRDASNTLAMLREAAGGRQTRLTDLVRPQPVFDAGKLKGFRVYPGKNRQAFARLGLRPGDLVTGVNGTALSDANQGMAMLKQFEGSVPLAITLERNGGVETLVLDPGQLAVE